MSDEHVKHHDYDNIRDEELFHRWRIPNAYAITLPERQPY